MHMCRTCSWNSPLNVCGCAPCLFGLLPAELATKSYAGEPVFDLYTQYFRTAAFLDQPISFAFAGEECCASQAARPLSCQHCQLTGTAITKRCTAVDRHASSAVCPLLLSRLLLLRIRAHKHGTVMP